MTKVYILRSPIRVYNCELLQSKAEGICTVQPGRGGPGEVRGLPNGDKGTEAGVFGIEGLSRALGVRHPRQQQGLCLGGREGGQPEKIQSIIHQ